MSHRNVNFTSQNNASLTQDLDKNKEKNSKIKRPWWKRILRIFGWIIFIIILLFTIIVLFVRSPWGQNIIVSKLTTYISDKTNTKFSIKKLFITFSGDIDLQGLYLEDQKGDTLLYSRKLQVGIPIWSIIQGNPISVDGLEWYGLRANVVRTDSIQGFNYQFLIDAFVTDTTTKTETKESDPPKISIGSIDFKDFKVNYDDAVTGMKANLDLGTFHFEGKNFDLKKMKFQVSELALENTKVNYIQSKPSPPSDSTKSELPFLSLDNLKLKNVHVYYKSIPDSIEADVKLADLQLQVPKADLAKQDIEVGKFILNNSNLQVKMSGKKKPNSEIDKDANPPEAVAAFIWPNWNVEVKEISLQNNHIHFQNGEKPTDLNTFNPDYIVLSNFNFKAENISLSKKEEAKIQITEFSFYESTGLKLKELSFAAALKPTRFNLDDLIVKTGNSSINLNLKTKFASIQDLINAPENAYLNLNLKNFVVDLKDAFVFQPELKKNEYIRKLATHRFSGEIKAAGKLTEVNLSKFLVNWGENTNIQTNGAFQNLTDPEQLYADIENFTFHSTRSDILQFVSEKDLGISIPNYIDLKTQLNGKLDDFSTITQLAFPEGKVKIDGNFKNQNQISFAADVDVSNLKLGKILKNPNIGTLDFKLQASGNGDNINNLNAELSSQFSKLEFSGYDFSALRLDGKLNAGKGNVYINYKDENLDLYVDSKIKLDSAAPEIAVDFQLEGADLYALGLTEKEIRAKLMMKANFKGNKDQFEFESHLTDGVAVYDKNNFYLGNVDLFANVSYDSTAMDIKSDFLNLDLRANAGIDRISSSIQNQLKAYFVDSTENLDSIANPVKLNLNLKLAESKIITDFLVPDIKTMDTLTLKVDFNEEEKTLIAKFDLPYIDYAEKTVDSLQLNFNSTANTADFRLGFADLKADPFKMSRTYFDGDLKNGMLNLNFNSFDGEEELYVLQTQISGKSDDLKFHILPEKLILHGEKWSMPEDNFINLQDKKIIAQNFVLSQNGQSLTVANDLMKNTPDNIGIGFENFRLSTLLALFNKENEIASGELNGDIVVYDPFNNTNLGADFNITNLTALQAPLGELKLKANSKTGETYNLDLSIQGDDVDLSVKGDYAMRNATSALDFNLDLNKIGMKTIAIISKDNLKDATGNISGKLAIKGSVTDPDYKGYLQFNDANFNVALLNAKFRLANDKIEIDNDDITLNKFSIEDEQNNSFTLDGMISTKVMADPEFNLTIKANNFQALNSTVKDNDVFYGKVNFDMDGDIKGNLSFPIVDVNLEINKETDFTYALQDAQAKIETREGIVEFVNKEDPDNILTRNTDSTDLSIFSGIELHANLKIDKGAEFNVIIDPKTGDNLNIAGNGQVDFNIAKNGRMTMSGRYDINSGHYKLSLYNLVKRQFDIVPGSYVTWLGDPMDADLNVSAKYNVETSASALMATQTAGASDEVKNKYRQKLPFFVYLNVNGELDQPRLDFKLDMPEDSRGAIDGTVYGRIRQLNSQEDELNKQVFSLLVLRKFYPNAGSDGSDGGAEYMVRKNINRAVSDQLNVFSEKLTGNSGIEVNFGLDSYTDYQGKSPEQRTDLNITAQKKLLNDRLIVQIGTDVNVEGDPQPGEENPLVGNASIQYLLTPDGRWRLKGFRNSEFENIIDGQVYVNGVAIIFQRQFNKFKELLTAPPKVEKEEDSKDDKKGTDEEEDSNQEEK